MEPAVSGLSIALVVNLACRGVKVTILEPTPHVAIVDILVVVAHGSHIDTFVVTQKVVIDLLEALRLETKKQDGADNLHHIIASPLGELTHDIEEVLECVNGRGALSI
jgi:hypothetical protein